MVHNPELTIADIATQLGFMSDSVFSRTFKKIYGQSPSAFRKNNLHNFSKIGKQESKNGQADFLTEAYLCNINHLKNWIKMNATIEITDIPKKHLAYITQIGVDGIENAFYRILRWAKPKQILENSGAKICRVFHDSFKFTDADKVRMSIGIVTDQPLEVDGEVGLSTIEKCRAIVGHFEIEPKDFEKAWSGLFVWMNEKGYKKSEGFPFEIYHNDPNNHPEKKSIVDLYIPIEG